MNSDDAIGWTGIVLIAIAVWMLLGFSYALLVAGIACVILAVA